MAQFHFKHNSIIFKILIPVLIVLLLQTLAFYASVQFGGTVGKLTDQAFDSLDERTSIRKTYLEDEMVNRWSNFVKVMAALETRTDVLDQTERSTPLTETERSEFLRLATDPLLDMLSTNNVTGSYLILSSSLASDADGNAVISDQSKLFGLYFRQAGAYEGDAKKVSVCVAPWSMMDFLKEKSILPDYGNSNTRYLSAEASENEGRDSFFYQPLKAYHDYQSGEHLDYKNLGYWAMPHNLFKSSNGVTIDYPVISYSVPLFFGDLFLGVLGVEVSVDYLKNYCMPYQELQSDAEGSYLLAVEKDSKFIFDCAASTGSTFLKLGAEDQVILTENSEKNGSYLFRQTQNYNSKMYGNVQYLNLYVNNTPFSNERWAIVGVMEESVLLQFSNRFSATMLVALAITGLLSILLIVFVSYLLTRPIVRLTEKVRMSSIREPVEFGKINIFEIDTLVGEIEKLNQNVVASASKLTQILSLAGMDVGAFEYDYNSKQLFFTGKFFNMFGISDAPKQGYLSPEEAKRLFSEKANFHREEVGGSDALFRVEGGEKGVRFIRLKMHDDEKRKLGVVTDVTGEISEKRKIQYERDFDSLTKLMSRQAFLNALGKLWKNPDELKISALLMLDVDNLKYVNDTYGHDVGDEYISLFGSTFRKLIPYNTLIARRSGDEFLILFYGYENEDEIRLRIRELKDWLQTTYLVLPNQSQMRLRASAGISWFPKDSTDMYQLIKYADFAMYKVKNSVKGEFLDFSLHDYSKESFMLEGQEQLNKLIDDELVDMYFQPIVDMKTASVFGYELLMRPRKETGFKNPLEVLMLAKAQSKLSKIERLTLLKTVQTIEENAEILGNFHIFMNSIPNQILNKDDLLFVEKKYRNFLERIVIEFTEEEKRDEQITAKKLEIAHRWGSMIAIDDFGTGYNSETILLEICPNFIKVDMFIVRNIDKDVNRQDIFATLVSHARTMGVKVIAEGVETSGELDKLIELGTDYAQGFLLGKPSAKPQPLSADLKNIIRKVNGK